MNAYKAVIARSEADEAIQCCQCGPGLLRGACHRAALRADPLARHDGERIEKMNKPVLPMSSLSLMLPKADGSLETYRLAASRIFPAKLEGTLNRVAFSAAHVVADPLADVDPWLTAAVDWDKTIAFREHVWDLGLGVAEAMDTAERGMGLDWPTSLELITRSVAAAKARGNALVFSGAGTDHLATEDAKNIDDVIRADEEQIPASEKAGGPIILMASRALAKSACRAGDADKVYGR